MRKGKSEQGRGGACLFLLPRNHFHGENEGGESIAKGQENIIMVSRQCVTRQSRYMTTMCIAIDGAIVQNYSTQLYLALRPLNLYAEARLALSTISTEVLNTVL